MHKHLLMTWAVLALNFSSAAAHADSFRDRVQDVKPSKDHLASLVPVLIEALSDVDSTVRANAGDALANLGPLALPKIMDLLGASDKKLRVEAAKVLGKMAQKGHRTADMLPPLVKALKDENVELRREASFALAQMVVGGRIAAGPEKVVRLAKVIKADEVFDLINRNKGTQTLQWPSVEIQRLAGADSWGDWRPMRGDVGEVVGVSTHPFDNATRVYILKIGKYYAPMGEKGVELLP